MVVRLTCVAIVLLWSMRAAAMESVEHKRLGDLSYHIALTTYCEMAHADQAVCEAISGPGLFFDPIKHEGQTGDSAGNLSYGDVVACVDYFLTSEKLIAGRDYWLIDEAKVKRPLNSSKYEYIDKGAPASVPLLYPTKRSQLDLRVATRCNPRFTNLENARAGHVNHTHFQAEMLIAKRNNHSLALFQRAVEENPFGALALNAVSDHYLHDSFAPGHITVWRSRLSDVVANSYHDFYNREGIRATIHRAKLRKEASVGGVNVLERILALLATPGPAQRFFMDAEQQKACGKPCPFMDSKNFGLRLEKLRTFIASDSEESIMFKGDNQLWKSEQDTQRLVMLLTSIRSIHDVLETRPAAKDGAPISFTDSSRDNKWIWAREALEVEPKRPWNGVRLEPSVIVADIGPVTYEVNRRYGIAADMAKSPANLIDNRQLDPIIGVNLGADTMTFGDNRNRWLAGVEGVLTGLTFGDGFLGGLSDEYGNLALVGGAQWFVGNGPAGGALSLRALIVQPQTESAFSVQLRALRIKSNFGYSEWHPALGVRFDMGFTSFMTVYLQGGRDWASQSDGRIRSGWSVGAGMQFGSAACHFPVISHMPQCK